MPPGAVAAPLGAGFHGHMSIRSARLAAAYGLIPVVRLAEALERAVFESMGAHCPRALYLGRLRDAIGCERLDEQASQAMLASISVRLGLIARGWTLVQSLLTTFVAAFLAEWGDKTQLLVIALAAGSSGRPQVLAAVALAALANSALAAFGGGLIHDYIVLRAISLLRRARLGLRGRRGAAPRQDARHGLDLADRRLPDDVGLLLPARVRRQDPVPHRRSLRPI